ncbi:MAG: hypothetical protein KJS91_07515 [Planctomycetes bacterium]|nr:hypothetical protein [Planctomycetota bacterium]
MRSALSKVAWIDSETLGASRSTQQVWFKVKPGEKFDLDGLKAAIGGTSGRYKFGKLLAEPPKQAS